MSNSFPELSFFIVDLILSFLILIFTLRILLSMSGASGNNPITQTIIKISRPIRYILLFVPNISRFELSSFLIIFICHFFNIYAQSSLLGADIIYEQIIIFSFKSSIFSLLNVLTIIFIVLAISSWFVQSRQINTNPALDIVYQISNPILYYIKRIIPTSVGVIDFSVIIALVLIHFLQNFINIIL
tara:strand:- start:3 stop:560 length:558 start_codon:yes stop_codon:yes gene_type:complete